MKGKFMNPNQAQAKKIIQKIISNWLRCQPERIEVANTKANKNQAVEHRRLDLPDDYSFRVIYRKGVNSTQLRSLFERIHNLDPQKRVPPFLLVLPYFTPAIKENCQKYDINWMDLCGNAQIKNENLIINIQGKKNRFKETDENTSIYTGKRSRVVRRLLLDPKEAFSQKTLASETNLSQPTISRTCKKLVKKGVVERIKKPKRSLYKIKYPYEVLRDWEQNYQFFAHDITRGIVAGKTALETMSKVSSALEKNNINDHAFTGPGAGSLWTDISKVRTCIVYLPFFPDKSLLQQISFEKSARGANLWLVVPKDNGVMMGQTKSKSITTVAPVQLYLDLVSSGIERSKEIAQSILENKIPFSEK